VDSKETLNKKIDELSAQVTDNPENEALRRELGLSYMNAGRYQESMLEFQKAAEINPATPDTFHKLGIIFDRLGKYKEAIKYYLQTIKINSEDPEVFMDLGLVYDQLQDYENAINTFKKVIALDPEDIDAYFHLGLAYDSLEDGENAIIYTMQAEKLADLKSHVQWNASSKKSLHILYKRYELSPDDFE
jgi:tetratricopeptide (TPR) repeat protein